MAAKFDQWLDLFIDEKGLDLEHNYSFTVNGTFHIMPVGTVVEFMKARSPKMKNIWKRKVVRVDFLNADIHEFFKYTAKGIAQYYSPKGF